MLELIVLGQIPGTGLVISFQSMLIAAALFTNTLLIYVLVRRRLVINTVVSKKA